MIRGLHTEADIQHCGINTLSARRSCHHIIHDHILYTEWKKVSILEECLYEALFNSRKEFLYPCDECCL